MINILKEITQASASDAYSEVHDAVLEGELNPLQVLVSIKILTEMFENLRNTLMPIALSELQRYGEKEVAMFGALLSQTEAGIVWDFKICGDPIWNMKKDAEQALASERKGRENVLRKFTDPFLDKLIDEETGEVTERPKSAPIRKSTTIVKIEFPKRSKK